MTEELAARLRMIEMVTGLVVTGWLVWMMSPGLQQAAKGLFAQQIGRHRRERRREREVSQMRFETFLVTEALSRYDGDRDIDRLRDYLDVAHAEG